MTETSPERATPRPSWLLDHLRLFRAPNVFTAAADVTAGYAMVGGGISPPYPFICLVLASMSLYTAGMVLNDVFDVAIDAQERPQRPLPSGRIDLNWARWLGIVLLGSGVAWGWLAGYLGPSTAELRWRSGMVATTLAGCVLLYDGLAKKTVLGAFVMGSCRSLNILLGMSVGVATAGGIRWAAAFAPWQLVIAAGLGLYIAGVTWFARSEARTSKSTSLAIGMLLMTAGLCLLAAFPRLGLDQPLRIDGSKIWPLMILLLGAPILRRCGAALLDPSPVRVQGAVKFCILSLIVLDAALCFSLARPLWSVAIVLLLVPTLALGRWVYST